LVALQSLKRISATLARLLALALVLAAGIASPANASVGETIILRCTHGQSLSGFSQQAYSEALKDLTADAREYTECGSLIRQAQLAAASGRGGSPGAAAAVVPINPTSSEQRAIAHATRAGGIPIRVGSALVHPGVIHANIASAFSSLPTPLLAMVIFLIACLLLIAGGAARNHLRARRNR
jgi:hypothetical protein